MWLLHTKTLELKEVTKPEDNEYAILSHVWEDSDRTQTFHDIRAIHARCVLSGEDPRSLVTEKVRRFCLYAARAGYDWVWLDTSCIDKSSSAELSEAINSIFAWYKQAGACYAYLCDVDDDDDPRSPESGFRRSRWHTRGWTLQELIAPQKVIFLSRGWLTIGSKVALVRVLADVSGIDRALLACRPGVSYGSFSVARRMSWASARETTRVEDRAYCLMGLFGITMPIIYGEGVRAFARLQAEILRTVYDDSVFAWGPIHSDLAFFDRGRLCIEPNHMPASIASDDDAPMLFVSGHLRWTGTYSLPLATSPSDFASSADYAPLSSRALPLETAGTDGQYTFTSHGLSIGMPISIDPLPVKVAGKNGLIDSNVYVAALRCTKLETPTRPGERSAARDLDLTAFVILFLTEMDPGKEQLSAAAGRRYYRVGAEVPTVGGLQHLRGAVVRTHHSGAALASVFAMRELIIIDPSRTQHLAPMYSWPTRVPDRCYQFYIPSWSLRRLQMQHGFDLQGSLVEDGATMIVSESQPAPSPKSRSINPVPVIFHFVNPWRDEVLTVRFGVGCECNSHFRPITPHDWWIDVHEGRQADPPGTYGCQFIPRDHGHSPPVSKLSFRNPRCTQRHVYLDPLNDVQQHVALELGDRTVHVQTALTEYYGLRSYKNPSPITVMIDLEGFERPHSVPGENSSGVAATTTASSYDHPHPPDNSTWLSRSWNSWGLPSIPMSIPPLTGLRSLKEWLASDVDYGYGSLV